MFAAGSKHQHGLCLSSAVYTYYLYTCIYTVLSVGKHSFRSVSTYFARERDYLHVTFAKRFVITLSCCMIMECKIKDILTRDLTRLSPRESTLGGRWTRKLFGLSRVQPIYLNVPRPS